MTNLDVNTGYRIPLLSKAFQQNVGILSGDAANDEARGCTQRNRILGAGDDKRSLKPAADQDQKELLADLLDGAQIGVERGTDLELAFRRAFTLAETRFPDRSLPDRIPKTYQLPDR